MPSDNRPLLVKVSDAQGGTIYSENDLTLLDFRGSEAISQLFAFDLALLTRNGAPLRFEKLLGQQVLVTLVREDGKKRFFHGICSKFSENRGGRSDPLYQATIVPDLWRLTRTVRSRVFDHKSVPQIVAEGLKAHGLHGKFLDSWTLDRAVPASREAWC